MKLKVTLIFLLLLSSNCSPETYSLNECYETHQDFQRKIDISFVEVTPLTSIHKKINSNEVESIYYEMEIIQDRTILALSEGPYKTSGDYMTSGITKFIKNNHQNIEKIYSVSVYKKFLFDKDDYDLEKIDYLIEFRDDNNLYFFRWRKLINEPYYSTEAFEEVYKNAGAGKSDYIAAYKILDEKYPLEVRLMHAYSTIGYSRADYLDNLESIKNLLSEYSYFLTNNQECVDIVEFSNSPELIGTIYSRVVGEINKFESDSEILYPSNIDWFR